MVTFTQQSLSRYRILSTWLILVWTLAFARPSRHVRYLGQSEASQYDAAEYDGYDDDQKNSTHVKPLNIAFCLTGQLARLEIKSKVKNIFTPNARQGNTVHVMVYLDDEIHKVKQTFWRYDYSNTPYINYTTEMLADEFYNLMKEMKIEESVSMWIQLAPPSQEKYEVVAGKIPVSDKIVRRPLDHTGAGYNDDGIEHADVRFQNNMRWMGALRDCTKWVQKLEYEQGFFYDVVVRLREDTYAFGPWIIDDRYRGKLTSAGTAAFRGINDHNFVVGRLYADDLFRGLTEDYYLNKTLSQEMWDNPEGRIYQMATAYNVPIQNNSICQQPLLPLRGRHDEKHWLAHAAYTTKLLEECQNPFTKLSGCECNERWLRLLRTSIIPIDLRYVTR